MPTIAALMIVVLIADTLATILERYETRRQARQPKPEMPTTEQRSEQRRRALARYN